jgi:hypothetical protein
MRKNRRQREKVAIVFEKQRFGISLNIMQPILSPVQQNLGRALSRGNKVGPVFGLSILVFLLESFWSGFPGTF